MIKLYFYTIVVILLNNNRTIKSVFLHIPNHWFQKFSFQKLHFHKVNLLQKP